MARFVLEEEAIIGLPNAADLDVQAVGEELEAIAAGSSGRLTPEAVVQAARDPGSPLHRHFEWDDAAAAEAYRRDQARALVRIVRTELEPGKPPVRAFISVRDAVGVSYRRVREVQGSAQLQLAVMKAAERDLEAFLARYRQLADVCEIVGAALVEAQARRAAVEGAASLAA